MYGSGSGRASLRWTRTPDADRDDAGGNFEGVYPIPSVEPTPDQSLTSA